MVRVAIVNLMLSSLLACPLTCMAEAGGSAIRLTAEASGCSCCEHAKLPEDSSRPMPPRNHVPCACVCGGAVVLGNELGLSDDCVRPLFAEFAPLEYFEITAFHALPANSHDPGWRVEQGSMLRLAIQSLQI